MLVSSIRLLVISAGLLLFIPAFVRAGQAEGANVWRLKRDVEERERQLLRAQRELAEARARVALAEGKRDAAIAELRKVVAGWQGEVQWLRDHASWFCDPRDLMTAASWDLAKARIQLAEAEGDTATLAAEWKKIVGFHEQEMERVRRLEQVAAVKPEERNAAQKALDQARESLAAAEKRLAAEAAKPPDKARQP